MIGVEGRAGKAFRTNECVERVCPLCRVLLGVVVAVVTADPPQGASILVPFLRLVWQGQVARFICNLIIYSQYHFDSLCGKACMLNTLPLLNAKDARV